MAMEAIAVTGGTGFVGSHLVRLMASVNRDARVLVRPGTGGVRPAHGEIIEGTLEDEAALVRLLAGVKTVVHCAGIITARSRALYDRINVAATARLVMAAGKAGVSRFVHISSIAAREPGLSDYGASKRQSEVAVRTGAGDMSWTILRPPAVYGPGDKGTLPLIKQISQKTATIPGNPSSRFSLIHAQDLARAILIAATMGPQTRQIYELHDGKPGGYSWADLAAIAGRVDGHTVECRYIPRALGDLAGLAGLALGAVSGRVPMTTPGKIRELYHGDWVAKHNLFGQAVEWAPEVSFEDGYRTTVKWYREHGWM